MPRSSGGSPGGSGESPPWARGPATCRPALLGLCRGPSWSHHKPLGSVNMSGWPPLPGPMSVLPLPSLPAPLPRVSPPHPLGPGEDTISSRKPSYLPGRGRGALVCTASAPAHPCYHAELEPSVAVSLPDRAASS